MSDVQKLWVTSNIFKIQLVPISKHTASTINTSHCRVGSNRNNVCMFCKVKGKGVPLQAWTGAEGFRRLRPPDFLTRHMKVVGCQSYAPAAVIPRDIVVLNPQGYPGTQFRAWVGPRAHGSVRCYGKNPGDTGNRSRDLTTCSAVP